MLDPFLMEVRPPGPGQIFLEDLWLPWRPMDLIHHHLNVGLVAIARKRRHIDRRWEYYRGLHTEKVLTEKFRPIMERSQVVTTMFTNYCSLVVDAPLSRLQPIGWKGNDIPKAEELWEENDLDLEAEEVHRHALCAGEAYVIVWPRTDPNTGDPAVNDQGESVYDIALQDARNCYVQYRTRRRRDREWACKVWLDVDRWRAIIYYPDEIVRLVSQKSTPPAPCPVNPLDFLLDTVDPGGPHDLKEVPVIRFARSFDGHSRLDDVIPIQDRLNKLVADKVIAAEFAAFPQRWALTNDDPPAEAVRAGPGGVWVIPPSSVSTDGGDEMPTRVGQFPSADLGNYDATIAREVNAFFTIAQLPRHLLVDPGVAPTGEAIKSDESPMIATVQGYRDLFTAYWRDVMKLCGLDVDVVWADIEVRNQLTQAQTMRELTTAGIPLAMAAKLALDLPEDQLKELEKLQTPPQPGAAVPGQGAQTVPGQPPQQGQLPASMVAMQNALKQGTPQ